MRDLGNPEDCKLSVPSDGVPPTLLKLQQEFPVSRKPVENRG